MSPLEITEISVHTCKAPDREDHLLGFARIVLNGAFVVNGIRIIRGKIGGPFISFPRERDKKEEGRVFNICHPINQAANQMISDRVLDEYNRLTKA